VNETELPDPSQTLQERAIEYEYLKGIEDNGAPDRVVDFLRLET
jgi:hypothetical protein